jgi:uncharacterized protein (DUF4415 family)
MATIKGKGGREILVPTPEEDAAITAGALSDADNPPLDDAFFERAVPFGEAVPALAGAVRRGRPRLAHDSRMVTLRMEGELVDAFKRVASAQGGAYQAIMREALRDWLRSRG